MVDIITPRSIYEFIAENPKFGPALEAWMSIVKSQNWSTPLDIVETFGKKATDILKKRDNEPSCQRVVIDIKGNHLRVIGKYQLHPKLKKARLYIKWIGTHAEYDEICKKNRQYDIDLYK